MSTFVASDCCYNYTFGSSLEYLEKELNIKINASTRERVKSRETDCEFYMFEDPESGMTIYEFVGEWKSFMQCAGPDSECCFLIPKTNIAFFIEMSHYFNESIKLAEQEGDQIIVTVRQLKTHKVTEYLYCYENGYPTDMMSFSLIELV